MADNPEEKKAKETSGSAVEEAKRRSKRTGGKPMRRQDYFPLFCKQIQEQPTRTHNNPPSPAGFLSEAIREGIHKIPGGSLLAAAANFAGQAFLSSVGGERAAALSPIRNRDKTVAIQTVGTQKFTFVNQDNKLAAAAAKGVPFHLPEEHNTQQGSEGAGINEDDRMRGNKQSGENTAPTASGPSSARAASRSSANLDQVHRTSGGAVEGTGLTTKGGRSDNKRSAQNVSESPNARDVPRSGVSTDREARSRTTATSRKSTGHLSASERKKKKKC